jgi:hypothetical protein
MNKNSLKGTMISLIIYLGILITTWILLYFILISRGGIT